MTKYVKVRQKQRVKTGDVWFEGDDFAIIIKKGFITFYKKNDKLLVNLDSYPRSGLELENREAEVFRKEPK